MCSIRAYRFQLRIRPAGEAQLRRFAGMGRWVWCRVAEAAAKICDEMGRHDCAYAIRVGLANVGTTKTREDPIPMLPVEARAKPMRPFKDGDLVRITNRESYHKGTIRAETRFRRDDGSIVWHFTGDTLSCTLKEGEFEHV
jgi:hypothetical protein